MEHEGYIHGWTPDEARRLLEQAEFLAPYVIDPMDLSGVERLLEVGAGVGAETRILLRRWPRLRVTGVDFSTHQLSYAKANLAAEISARRVSLVRASGEKLPFSEGTFDGAVFIWVLEHVPHPARLVAEAARCLRPGGRLLASEVYNTSFHVEPRRPIIDEFFAAMCEVQRAGGGHPDIGARLPEMAANAGLEIARFELRPALGDARDPERRTAWLRYFQRIMESSAPQVVAAGAFPEARVPEVWAAFDEVVASPDALFCYTAGQLDARKTRLGRD